jgi:mRNA interferase RelE/StbE
MQVEFLHRFGKDIDNINLPSVKKAIHKLIINLESAKNISEIPNVKKLKGFKSAYRIRIGDYRIGFFIEQNIVTLARVLHQKEIYNSFP